MLLTQCRNFYLYWWQHGGRGSCCGDVRLHRAANALPAAVNALPPPPPLRCPHLHRGATAKDAALPPGYRNAVKLAATATLPPPLPPPPATLTLPMPPPRCPPSLRHCCYLYWWQHGGPGSCCGDVRLHRAADALPATVNALLPPPTLRCPHLRRGATAKDATLPPGCRNAAKLATTTTLPPLPLPPPPPRCCCRAAAAAATALPPPLPRCRCRSRAAAALQLLHRRHRHHQAAAAATTATTTTIALSHYHHPAATDATVPLPRLPPLLRR